MKKKEKNKNKNKKQSLSICIQMALANFNDFGKKKIILVQKFWRQKSIFGDFSKMQFITEKSYYLNIFLLKFAF